MQMFASRNALSLAQGRSGIKRQSEGTSGATDSKARQTINKSLDNPEIAKWYMERKKKLEFFPPGNDRRADGLTSQYGSRESSISSHKKLTNNANADGPVKPSSKAADKPSPTKGSTWRWTAPSRERRLSTVVSAAVQNGGQEAGTVIVVYNQLLPVPLDRKKVYRTK